MQTTVNLPTGQYMPIVGYGTWQAAPEELEVAINTALEAGYRHIDTSPVYMNEYVIGNVLKKWLDSGKIKRDDLFIVTKLPPSGNRPAGVEKHLKKSLRNLQINYLDLYLIHTPFAFIDVENNFQPKDENGHLLIDSSTDHLAVWREMERMVINGLTKAIGISNFNLKQIENIVNIAKIPISMLQIELHLYFQQQETVQYCKNKGIPITAYSPLGSRGLVKLLCKSDTLPNLLENPTVLKLSKKYNKTPAQIALKYIIEKSIAVIPKSINQQRIKDNIRLFDWKLDSEDVLALSKLDQGPKGRICDFEFLCGVKNHPEFPF
ncbi:PREDICTED: alcohol dehydrogenase [NADP(+)] [Ceratosolen solmsi marchali]|uniref:Alcohol dehydrogenase [NADP(+)] n=1 Tax=Ceratosolen solmsi marchali TaxID=326594 RepID=A0AAJ6YMR9_9HYME|nr:PREDICTED: alcohol dehydrogenase [NADP(+)] [Ceratosolen solmsi marchali]